MTRKGKGKGKRAHEAGKKRKAEEAAEVPEEAKKQKTEKTEGAKVPVLKELRDRIDRKKRSFDGTTLEKSAPLIQWDYETQLSMKNLYVKTAVRSFSKLVQKRCEKLGRAAPAWSHKAWSLAAGAPPGCSCHDLAAIPSQGMGHLACPDDSADSSTEEAPVELRFHEPTAVRMRFFNFNMANIAALDPFVGMFAQFLEQPFSDGAPVDLAFVALTEARFKMRGFVEEQLEAWHRKPPASGLDTLVHRDALRKKTTSIYNPFSWCRKKLVQRVVGNVKTVLGFRQELFQVEQGETRLDGAFTLNPEKALLGSSIVRRGDGLRLCFFGTHFPMRRLQMVLTSSLEASEKLMAAKIEYARVLREVLCKVMAWELTKHNTVIFVQGDLNSRTVFDDHESGGSQAKDVLLEVLNDASLMAAIASDLRLPHGRWHEVVPFSGVNEMPVTYKVDPKMCIAKKVTVGDILNRVHDPAQPAPHSSRGDPARQLASVHRREFGNEWGLKKDPAKVKPTHFPAFTERVIYWAPDSLACQMSFVLPDGGYETVGHIDGSDHRPVLLEALMVLGPGHRTFVSLPPTDAPEVKDLNQKLTNRRFLEKLICMSDGTKWASDKELVR
eukprot:s3440_g1.t1